MWTHLLPHKNINTSRVCEVIEAIRLSHFSLSFLFFPPRQSEKKVLIRCLALSSLINIPPQYKSTEIYITTHKNNVYLPLEKLCCLIFLHVFIISLQENAHLHQSFLCSDAGKIILFSSSVSKQNDHVRFPSSISNEPKRKKTKCTRKHMHNIDKYNSTCLPASYIFLQLSLAWETKKWRRRKRRKNIIMCAYYIQAIIINK